MKRVLALAGLLLALSACSGVARTATPDPAQQEAAAARAQALAEAQTAAQARARQAERVEARTAVDAAASGVRALLQTLRRWQGRGEVAQDAPDEVVAVGRSLGSLDPLSGVCTRQLPSLGNEDDDAPAREVCSLAQRARGITERQMQASVRRAFAFPDWLAEIAPRYRSDGRVSWQQLHEFDELDARIAQRTQDIGALMVGWRAALPRDLFSNVLATRHALNAAIAERLDALDLPLGVADPSFSASVKRLIAQRGDQGPYPGHRAELLEVRALDRAWQVFVSAAGKPLRRARDGAVRVRIQGQEACVGLWLRIEQEAGPTPGRWQAEVLRWDDDVRILRCAGPKQPDESAPAPVLAQQTPRPWPRPQLEFTSYPH